jgi:hypothetical protein
MSKGNLTRRIRWYVVGLGGIFSLVILFWSSACENASVTSQISFADNTSPVIPDSLTFCGELVPIEFFDVKEALERELLVNAYWHSQTILFIKKAERYFPEIEPILKENGIPDDFKYLAIAESGLANVVSPSGAVGFWQLLEGTAKDYGLEINDEIDERYHLKKATGAACSYLQQSFDKYNNWTLAAASYNVGRKGVDRQIEKQKESNYYNLLFNDETARYVYRIIALKLVIENPANYSFNITQEELYQPILFDEIKVDTTVASWADFAQIHNTNYKLIKKLNPWLRDSQLTNKFNKEYVIRIPQASARKQ